MTGPYDDMLNLPHPTSRRHPRMSLSDRAAQFAPFCGFERTQRSSRGDCPVNRAAHRAG